MTEPNYDAADAIRSVLERSSAKSLTAAMILRSLPMSISWAEVSETLAWMVTEKYLRMSGNGSWQKYWLPR